MVQMTSVFWDGASPDERKVPSHEAERVSMETEVMGNNCKLSDYDRLCFPGCQSVRKKWFGEFSLAPEHTPLVEDHPFQRVWWVWSI